MNIAIILAWIRQIDEEKRAERVERLKDEVRWWDGEIERLEELLNGVSFFLGGCRFWYGMREKRRANYYYRGAVYTLLRIRGKLAWNLINN